ncbi:MAG: hypothetical protein ACRDHP_14185 [Ktedonobacterales bacterium]
MLKSSLRSAPGQALVEFAMVVGLIVLAGVGIIAVLGPQLSSLLAQASKGL